MLIRRAELVDLRAPQGRPSARAEISAMRPPIRDLRIRGGRIVEIAERLGRVDGEEQLDADGGALLPGLHDHHLHLFALAAADHSIRCGPPAITSEAALTRVLRGARPSAGWIRGVGYFETVAGQLDRALLDRIRPEVPVRVQHRSGAMWVVNTLGLARLGLDTSARMPGLECDAAGRATGRLYDLDELVAERSASDAPPCLDATSRRLASYGVTGVTDATPANDGTSLEHFAAASARGELRQRLVLMGRGTLPEPSGPGDVSRGPVKLVLREAAMPEFEAFADEIRGAHEAGRAVAIHCVTRAEGVFACAALAAVGSLPGDRIEHAAVAPPELAASLRDLGLRVVTQPNFVAERGDDYLRDVEARDRPWLYRCGELARQGVRVAAGTDAPFGDADPWRAMRAAVERRTAAGCVLGEREAVAPETAVALFGGDPARPGDAPSALRVGSRADLCVLGSPWADVRGDLDSRHVAATLRAGEVLYRT